MMYGIQERPVIRLRQISLKNMKSVRAGSVRINGLNPEEYGAEILGLYGQNGSGKTTLIEALSILKRAMCGEAIPPHYTRCIRIGDEDAELSFTFEMRYGEERMYEAVYQMKLSLMQKDEGTNLCIHDEVLKLACTNPKFVLQKIFDTSEEECAFGPLRKRREILGGDKDAHGELLTQKSLAYHSATSFLFKKDTLEILHRCGGDSLYVQILRDLNRYAEENLFVLDTRSTGMIQGGWQLPIRTRQYGNLLLNTCNPNWISEDGFQVLEQVLSRYRCVWTQLIPGFSVSARRLATRPGRDGGTDVSFELISHRGEETIPFAYESDGVKRIVSEMGLFIAAFNDPSTLVAIDELDVGIFEFLLGQLLRVFQTYGSGQLIFTSHNLRPLEIIDKKFICFTTGNPENRYMRLQGLGVTNNLRDTYLREILVGEQKESLYNLTNEIDLSIAFLRAKEE